MEDFLYLNSYEVEKKHWWFVARQRIIQDILQSRLKLPSRSKVLDVGCGTGAILEMLATEFDAHGIDQSPLAIEFCKKRGLKNLHQCALEAFPQDTVDFDLVTFLDVIEHIDDDLAVLRLAHEILKPGGFALITVPAYKFLWSEHDEANHHKRRYGRAQLRGLLRSAGFTVKMISYYNTILFPLALFARLASKALKLSTRKALDIPPRPLNSILTWIFSFEKFFLRVAVFPFGLSIIALACKSERVSHRG
jgi:2-polyprenyl-3-methyl-5-hydroxy-6-metoxy-1,4-benzoquinol methylase